MIKIRKSAGMGIVSQKWLLYSTFYSPAWKSTIRRAPA